MKRIKIYAVIIWVLVYVASVIWIVGDAKLDAADRFFICMIGIAGSIAASTYPNYKN